MSAAFSCSSWLSMFVVALASRGAGSSGPAAGSPRPRRAARGPPGRGASSAGSVSAAISRDRRQVAQRAGRILDVRLELIERVVELRVALVDQRVQRADDVRVRAGVMERRLETVGRARDRRRPARASSSASRNSGLSTSSRANSSISRTWWPTTRPRSQSGCRMARSSRSSACRDGRRTGRADRCRSAGTAGGGRSRRSPRSRPARRARFGARRRGSAGGGRRSVGESRERRAAAVAEHDVVAQLAPRLFQQHRQAGGRGVRFVE